MKLYIMECIEDPKILLGEDSRMFGQKEYFIKLETKAEWRILENFASYGTDKSALNSMIRTTGDEVMGDDDIYYYINVDEPDFEIGDFYTDIDDLTWVRRA